MGRIPPLNAVRHILRAVELELVRVCRPSEFEADRLARFRHCEEGIRINLSAVVLQRLAGRERLKIGNADQVIQINLARLATVGQHGVGK